MNLARAELRRLVKRRVTRWLLLLVVAVLGLLVVSEWSSSEKLDEAALRSAQVQAQRDYEQARRDYDLFLPEQIAECERAQRAGGPGAEGWPADCQEVAAWGPRPEDFRAEFYLPRTFEFRWRFEEMATPFAWLLAMFAFFVAASYVGAEWRSGGMANLLLWRPRRAGVLGTKLAALMVGLTAAVVGLSALWTAALWWVAVNRGITSTMTPDAWRSFGLTGLRVLALVLVAGVVGFAVASLGRHTAAALGTAIAAFVVGVGGVSALVYSVGVRFPDRWLWPMYMQAWLERSVELFDFRAGCPASGPCEPETYVITWQMAGLGMAGLVVLLVGAAMWHMRSRDVT
ncbi:MAG TPA: ABC transporter permease subunit [Natronosporangium sp.]|nr:ABC transporter permease subunit [Natronosporangium sp.]